MRKPPSSGSIVEAASYQLSARGLAKHLAPGTRRISTEGIDLLRTNCGGRDLIYLDDGLWDRANEAKPFQHADFDPNFFLAWPPNLFAFTSLFFELTGAYAMVVSDWWLQDGTSSAEPDLPDSPDVGVLDRVGQAELKGRAFQREIRNYARDWRVDISTKLQEECVRELIWSLIPACNIRVADAPGADESVADVEKKLCRALGLEPGFQRKVPLGDSADRFAEQLDLLVWQEGPIRGWWDTVEAGLHSTRVADIRDIWLADSLSDSEAAESSLVHDNRELFRALWQLHVLADTAATGWGVRPDLVELMVDAEDQRPRTGHDVAPASRAQLVARNEDLSGNTKSFPWVGDAAGGSDGPSFVRFLARLLRYTGTLAFVSSDRARVLPKRHTPPAGISLRACSSSLAFHRSAIDVEWRTTPRSLLHSSILGDSSEDSARNTLRVLLFPWPFTVKARDFQHRVAGNGRYHLFDYEHPAEHDAASELDALIEKAIEESSEPPDLVLMPEVATTNEHLREKIFPVLLKHDVPAYVIGVASKNGAGTLNELRLGWIEPCATAPECEDCREPRHQCQHAPEPQNLPIPEKGAADVYYLSDGSKYLSRDGAPAQLAEEATYRKHHRWQLNERQVRAYHLGSQLPAKRDVALWEGIALGQRNATFANFADDITVTGIICEDLARQSSLSELIRDVGPNLVIVALMDGPQRTNRWPSRYAGVFGDDPGCAVLTLTSRGMMERSGLGFSRPSRAIALWAERGGAVNEIELPVGASGMLLTLQGQRFPEPTLDGRSELYSTHTLSLVSTVPLYPERVAAG